MRSADRALKEPIVRTEPVRFDIKLHKKRDHPVNVVLRFKDGQGNFLFVSPNTAEIKDGSGAVHLKMTIPANFFNEGTFYVDLLVSRKKEVIFLDEDALDFTVLQEAKSVGQWMGTTKGALKPSFQWDSI